MVIVISAECDSKTLQEAMSVGAREYLIKPYTSQELIGALRRIGRDVWAARQRAAEASKLRIERNQYLKQLAR